MVPVAFNSFNKRSVIRNPLMTKKACTFEDPPKHIKPKWNVGDFLSDDVVIWAAKTMPTDRALRPSSEGMFLGFILKNRYMGSKGGVRVAWATRSRVPKW
jgi:hypothetical protein